MGNLIPSSNLTPFFGVVDPKRQGLQGDVHWKLETIEPKGLKFKNISVSGQLPLKEEGITIRANQVIPEAATHGVPFPFIQWVRGELQVITFDVILFSRDKDENILLMFEEMQKLQGYIRELGRIPICRFTYGNIISVKCMVGGFGDIKIARAKNDGWARKIEFTMTLKRFVPHKVKEIDRNARPKFSRLQTVAGDDRMYEIVARREYGNDAVLFGDRLRKLNRLYPFAADEDVKIKIPDRDKVVTGRIAPEFHAFQLDNEEVAEMFLARATTRNEKILVV